MNAVRELRDVIAAMQQLDEAAVEYALATIIAVEGSTYRLPGARQLVPAAGTSVGTVSGGCLEGEVESAARDVISAGRPEVRVYDLTADDDMVWGWGLGCNGITTVLFEPAATAREAAAAIGATLDGTAPAALVTDVVTAQRMVVRPGEIVEGSVGGARVDREAARLGSEAVESGTTRQTSVSDGDTVVDLFIEAVRPAPRLIVCGTGRDAQPLVAQAAALGFDVFVADERPGAPTHERFPTATGFLVGPPATIAGAVQPGRDTYAVLMSHNFLRDGDYLAALCGTPVRYIGLLGPKERSHKLLEYVRGNGVEPTDTDLAVMFGPAGLDIGADGPQEIAWAILAEILAVRGDRPAGYLRDRSESIHPKHE